MARKPRVLLEGGIYHVYCRTARGTRVFEDEREVQAFLDLLREIKARDGLTVFAWCVLSNHYHLSVRTSQTPLSRSMRLLQGRFAQDHNRRHDLSGHLWQGRYRAELVEDQRYFEQLLFYIHLNPVEAGMVTDPAEYRFSGHRELLGAVADPIVDVDSALLAFGESLAEARQAYVAAMRGAGEEAWISKLPGSLPWWSRQRDRQLRPERGLPHVDVLGRSTGRERPSLSAEEFVARVCEAIEIDLEALASGRRHRVVVRARELLATLGIERYGLQAKVLGAILNRHPDWVSCLASRGAKRRVEDPEYRQRLDVLDAAVATPVPGPEGDETPAAGDADWGVWH